MQSAIAQALNLKTDPVALLHTDVKPAGALQFEPGKWGCVMSLFAAVATKGKTAVFDWETYGCFGGGYGLGFGDTYAHFPGAHEGFCNFLSTGNAGWETGEKIAAGMQAGGARSEFVGHFLHGERYKQNPWLVRSFVADLPQTSILTLYAAFIPLADLDPAVSVPESVTFLVSPDQFSALTVLANYDRPGLENVALPWVAACQSVGILAYREAQRPQPRCVAGLVDLSARKYLRLLAGAEVLTFTIPWQRFQEMEGNVAGSFLEQEPWLSLRT